MLCGNGAEVALQALNALQTERVGDNAENGAIEFLTDPEHRRGRASLMLKYIALHDRLVAEDMFSAPLYIRRSDAERNVEEKGAFL
jgi:hypothetical protein